MGVLIRDSVWKFLLFIYAFHDLVPIVYSASLPSRAYSCALIIFWAWGRVVSSSKGKPLLKIRESIDDGPFPLHPAFKNSFCLRTCEFHRKHKVDLKVEHPVIANFGKIFHLTVALENLWENWWPPFPIQQLVLFKNMWIFKGIDLKLKHTVLANFERE